MTDIKTENEAKPQNESKDKAKKKVTIGDFIEENHKLFTVLGVFGGLTALFTRLENSSYLAAISFVLLILLDFELWIKFPKSEEATFRLRVFEVLLQFLLMAVGLYIVQEYQDFVFAFMPLIFMIIFGVIFIKLFDRFEVFKPIRRISQKSERFK
ncbi:MAG: hypothetical protein WC325_02615, partial [Candidatus Bathyarchaeia archaeon]